MPRAGSTKVRTGCYTCKSRKVKCDETRPYCRRCLLSSRVCNGYPEVRGQAQYSWTQLLHRAGAHASDATRLQQHHQQSPLQRLPTSIIPADEQAARAHAFFHAQVAPALSRHSSAPFWTVRVAQVAAAEPAVYHALTAISALYEGLAQRASASASASASTSISMTSTTTTSRPRELSRKWFAINHYNRALGHLTAPETDRSIVLLVCLLFICIEAMQGDKDMAIAHCRHGILICNSMPNGGLRGWAREELQPIFLRLATFPYFFGMEAGEFPEPVGLVAMDGDKYGQFDASSTGWDALVNQTVRVVRQGLSHRQGPLRDSPIPDSLAQEQRQTLARLEAWREHYRTQRMGLLLTEEDLDAHLYREMEAIAGLVWAACCLDASEMGYDAYTAAFTELLALSQDLIDRRSTKLEPRPIFSLEMGFTPFLYFSVIKCRHLDLRVRALQHILRLGYDQENLFNTRVMYSVGLRLVELEHGIELDPAWPQCAGAADEAMPGDEMRLRTADITEDKEVRVDEDGQIQEYTKVYFLLQPKAIVPGHLEWVKTHSLSSGLPESPALGSTYMSTERE